MRDYPLPTFPTGFMAGGHEIASHIKLVFVSNYARMYPHVISQIFPHATLIINVFDPGENFGFLLCTYGGVLNRYPENGWFRMETAITKN